MLTARFMRADLLKKNTLTDILIVSQSGFLRYEKQNDKKTTNFKSENSS